MVKTVPHIGHDTLFEWLEGGIICVFATEYVLRLYSIGSSPYYQKQENHILGSGRLCWALTDFFALVDVASTLPWFIDLLIPGDVFVGTSFLRVLRLLKMGHYIKGL